MAQDYSDIMGDVDKALQGLQEVTQPEKKPPKLPVTPQYDMTVPAPTKPLPVVKQDPTPTYIKTDVPGSDIVDIVGEATKAIEGVGGLRRPRTFTSEEQQAIDNSSILGEAGKGLARGTVNVAASLEATGALGLQTIGAEESARALITDATDWQKQTYADQAPAIDDVETLYDNLSVGNFGRYVASVLGEQTPILASIIGSGGTALLARAGAIKVAPKTMEKVAKLKYAPSAGVVGAGGAGFAMETGGTATELFDATDEIHVVPSVVAGAIKTGFETITPLMLARKMKIPLGDATKLHTKLTGEWKAGRLGHMFAEGIKTGSIEGLTEGIQETVDIITRDFVDENYNPTSAEVGSRILNASAAGFLTGSVLSSGLSAMDKNPNRKPSGDPWAKQREFKDLVGEPDDYKKKFVDPNTPEGFVPSKEADYLGEEDAEGNIIPPTSTNEQPFETPSKVDGPVKVEEAPAKGGTPIPPKPTKGLKLKVRPMEGEPTTSLKFRTTDLSQGVLTKVQLGKKSKASMFNLKARPEQAIAEPIGSDPLPDPSSIGVPLVEGKLKSGLKFRKDQPPQGGRVQVPDLQSGRYTKTVNDGGVAKTTSGINFRKKDAGTIEGEVVPEVEPTPVQVEPEPVVPQKGKLGFKKKRGLQTIQIGKKGQAVTAEDIDQVTNNAGVPDSLKTPNTPVQQDVNVDKVREVISWVTDTYKMGEGPEASQRVIQEIGQGKIAQVMQAVQTNPGISDSEIRTILKGTFFAGESSRIVEKVKSVFQNRKPNFNVAIVNDLLNKQPEFRFEVLTQIILNNNITVDNFEELVYVVTEVEDLDSIKLLGQSFGLNMPNANKKDLVNTFNSLIDQYNVYVEFSKVGKFAPLTFKDFLKAQFALNASTVAGRLNPLDLRKLSLEPESVKTPIQQKVSDNSVDMRVDEADMQQLLQTSTYALDMLNRMNQQKWTQPLYANVSELGSSTSSLLFDTAGGLYDYHTQKNWESGYYTIDMNKVAPEDKVAGLNGLYDVMQLKSALTLGLDEYIGTDENFIEAQKLASKAATNYITYKINRALGNVGIVAIDKFREDAVIAYDKAIALGLRLRPTAESGVQVLNLHKYVKVMQAVPVPRLNVTVGNIQIEPERKDRFYKDLSKGVSAVYFMSPGGINDSGFSIDLDKIDHDQLVYIPPGIFYQSLFSRVKPSQVSPDGLWKHLQELGVTARAGEPSAYVKADLHNEFLRFERANRVTPDFYNMPGFISNNVNMYIKFAKSGILFEGAKHSGIVAYNGPLSNSQIVQTSFVANETSKASNFTLPVMKLIESRAEALNVPSIQLLKLEQENELITDSPDMNADPLVATFNSFKPMIENVIKKYKLGKVYVKYSNFHEKAEQSHRGFAGFIDPQQPNKGFEIWIKHPAKSKEALFEVLAHELGHVIVYKWFSNLDIDSQLLLRENYLRDMKKYSTSNIVDFNEIRMASMYKEHADNKDTYNVADMQDKFHYFMSFEEWLANKISNAFTIPNSPVSKLDKLINKVKIMLINLFRELKTKYGVEYKGNPTVTKWLEMIENGELGFNKPSSPGTLARALDRGMLPENYSIDLRLDASSEVYNSVYALDTLSSSINDTMQSLKMPTIVRRNAQSTTKAMKKWKWWMKQGLGIAQLAQLYPNVKQLGEFTSLLRQWHNKRTEVLSRANDTIIQWRGLGKDRADRLTKLIFYIGEMEYRTPQEVAQKIRRLPTQQEEQAAFRQFNIDADMQAVYRRQRNDFAQMLQDFGQLWLSQVSKFIKDPIKQAAKKLEIQGEIADLLAAPYFPHTRFGKYGVTVRERIANGFKIHEFHLAESEKEQKLIATEMATQYPASGGFIITENVMPEDTIHMQGMPPFVQRAMLDQLRKVVTDPATMRGVEQAIGLYALKSAPTQSFRKRFMKRKNLDGYSFDSQRVYAHYFMGASGHYARALFEDDMRHQINSLRKDARMYAGNSNTISNIANAMAMHMDAVFNPVNDWAGLRAFAGLWYLGFSPAAALTNMFQIPSFTVPYLTAHFGTFGGTKEVTKTIAVATTRLTDKWLKHGIWNSNVAKDGAIQEAIKSGVLDESITSDVAAAANISAISKLQMSNKARRGYESVARWGFIMFRGTEKLNRWITFESAYELAIKHPQAPKLQEFVASIPQSEIAQLQLLAASNNWGWTQDHINAYLFATQAVRASQFEYGSYAKPNFLRGKKGAILTFYTYIQSSLFFFRFAPGGVRSLLVLAYIGGLMGLPFAEDLNAIIKMIGFHIFGKDWNIEKAVREYYIALFGENPTIPPDMMLHGASRSSFGLGSFGDITGLPIPRLDLSGSLSSGRVIPGLSALEPKADFAKNMGEASKGAFGAGFNIPLNIVQALSDYQQPMTSIKRWEKAMPRALRGLTKGGRYMINGEETNRSGATFLTFDRTDPVQLAEIVSQSMGFNLTRATRKWDAIAAIREVDYIYETRRQLLFSEYYRAVKSQNKDDLNSVIEEIKTFNNDIPNKERAIKMDNLRKSVRQRLKGESKFENLEPTLKSQRSAVEEIKKLYPEIGETSVQEYD